MPAKKITVAVMVIVTILLIIRSNWSDWTGNRNMPAAQGGVLDLRGWDWSKAGVVKLQGEWEFYREDWLTTDSGQAALRSTHSPLLVPVPGKWNHYVAEAGATPYGSGAFHLRVLMDEDAGPTFGVRLTNVRMSNQLTVNDRVIGGSGTALADARSSEPLNVPYVAITEVHGGEADIWLRVANFSYAQDGGIFESVRFGLASAVIREQSFFNILDAAILVSLLLFSSTLLLLSRLRRERADMMYFALFCLFTALYLSFRGVKLGFTLNPELGFETAMRLQALGAVGGTLFLLLFAERAYKRAMHPRAVLALLLVLTSYGLLYATTGFSFYSRFEPGLQAVVVASCAYVLYSLLRSAIKQGKEAMIHFVAMLFFLSGLFTDYLGMLGVAEPDKWRSLQTLAAVFGFMLLISHRFIRTYDQTDRLSKQLLEADKRKDEFLANTSHELRTPIHAVIQIAQSVLTSGKGRLEVKQLADIGLIVSVGRRLSHLLNDLLDLSRLNAGGVPLRRSSVHVRETVSAVLEVLQFLRDDESAVRLDNRVPYRIPPVYADEQRLTQMLFNLLHNALKFTQAGSITVTAREEAGMVEIAVIDTGAGIPKELLSAIFRPFEQGAPSPSAAYGTGIGLSITKKLAELQGGRLTVESAPGKGSIFRFTLPIATEADAEEEFAPALSLSAAAYKHVLQETAAGSSSPALAEDEAEAGPDDAPRVLVVDDEPVNRKIMADLLSQAGLRVTTVPDGRQALAKLEGEPFWDLIVLDVMMPNLSGLEVCRRIRERYSPLELPVLMLTAGGRAADVTAGFSAGANDFVAKPVEPAELLARVRTLIALKRSLADRRRAEHPPV